MRCIRLLVEYDGTDFHGWQIQPRARTVQGELERAARAMLGQDLTIGGASRTDAGVHALGQVAHLRTESTIAARQYAKGLTALSAPDVAVVESREAAPEFSARHDARGKTYRYLLWNDEAPSPLRRRTSWHIRRRLDLAAMNEGAAQLVGVHDFATFRAAECSAPTTIRELRRLEVGRGEDDLVVITVEGTAFLQHMVRIIVGTLVQVGQGKVQPAKLAEIRDARDRSRAGQTAPPNGLCLLAVHY